VTKIEIILLALGLTNLVLFLALMAHTGVISKILAEVCRDLAERHK
jgi:hypothetical protein